ETSLMQPEPDLAPVAHPLRPGGGIRPAVIRNRVAAPGIEDIRHITRVIDRRDAVPAAAIRNDERANMSALAVIDAGAPNVPTAYLHGPGHMHVQALVWVVRRRELHDVGVCIRRGDRLP